MCRLDVKGRRKEGTALTITRVLAHLDVELVAPLPRTCAPACELEPYAASSLYVAVFLSRKFGATAVSKLVSPSQSVVDSIIKFTVTPPPHCHKIIRDLQVLASRSRHVLALVKGQHVPLRATPLVHGHPHPVCAWHRDPPVSPASAGVRVLALVGEQHVVVTFVVVVANGASVDCSLKHLHGAPTDERGVGEGDVHQVLQESCEKKRPSEQHRL